VTQRLIASNRRKSGPGKRKIRSRISIGTGASEDKADAKRNLAVRDKRAVSYKPGFPIVGLGASAGGLEALVEFFNQMPPDAGIAFVVVTHQDRDQSNQLATLLQECTKMPVLFAVDRMRLKPNCVFFSQPGYLGVKRGRLRFKKANGDRLPLHPIDYFFRSLAEDKEAFAAAIVLSGNSSDGVVGIGSIKQAMGLVMAQDPQSAKYPSMPARAIATRLVDYVLPASKMAQRLVTYLKGPYYCSSPKRSIQEDLVATLPAFVLEIILLIRARTGHDFSGYRPTTILSRIERRMAVLQVREPQEYLNLINDNPHELEVLFRELLVAVTRFFRDPDDFAVLRNFIEKELLTAPTGENLLRVWVPGCATGEEAYSVAIVLREAAERCQCRFSFQILATDLDGAAIDVARKGLYPDGIAADLSAKQLNKSCTEESGFYRIKKTIRETLTFAYQDIIKDPPFPKIDLIFCRNVLIDFNAALQKRALLWFHSALKPGGLLFLGRSEDIGDLTARFTPLDPKIKIFRRIGPTSRRESPGVSLTGAADVPAPHLLEVARTGRIATPRMTSLFQELLLQRFVPDSIIALRESELRTRAVADLSQRALAGCDLDSLLDDAIAKITNILHADFCSVLELMPDSNALRFRAGVLGNENWRGIMMPVQTDSQDGFTLRSESPVIVENLPNENRFRASVFLLDQGAMGGVSLKIPKRGRPFGLLDTYSKMPRKFSEREVHFLQSMVNVLAMAIERGDLENDVTHISSHEQVRIGQDIHDGVCQQLAGIQYTAELIAKKLPVNAPAKAELAKLADRTRQVIAEARSLASGLSLASLQSQGLTAALEELTINTQVSSKIQCALKCERPIPINDLARATHIYRIVQQAVHNAIKHGKPKNVFVDVTIKENQVMLSIIDDGSGLKSGWDQTSGIGLRSMNYRARIIGGTFSINPVEPHGTQVICSFGL
jgi:chemotaxis methyl-accepting protein methylase/signal transduction histidine kinase